MVFFSLGLQPVQKVVQDTLACSGKTAEPGRMKHLGDEVAAETAPRVAVGGGAYVKLVSCVGKGFGAVSEDNTFLN